MYFHVATGCISCTRNTDILEILDVFHVLEILDVFSCSYWMYFHVLEMLEGVCKAWNKATLHIQQPSSDFGDLNPVLSHFSLVYIEFW